MIDVHQCLLTCYEDCVINVNFFLIFSLHDRLEKEQRIPEVHIPSKPMSENFDDTISQLNVHKRVPITSKSPDDTDLSLNQTVDESVERPVSFSLKWNWLNVNNLISVIYFVQVVECF